MVWRDTGEAITEAMQERRDYELPFWDRWLELKPLRADIAAVREDLDDLRRRRVALSDDFRSWLNARRYVAGLMRDAIRERAV